MGTDIHVYIERKGKDGKWEYGGLYDAYFKEVYDDSTGTWVESKTLTSEPCEIYANRNYNLFSLLGENYRGEFETVVPIHGAPDDMSDEVSALTLDEDTGKPSTYYFEYNWVLYSELDSVMEMLRRMRKLSKRDKEIYRTFRDFYVIVDNARWQSRKTIGCRSDEIRIVYWFDN